MDTPLWTRISRVNSFNHRELDGEDICLFLHTRETHQYGEIDQWSYAYQTIENFKISPVALQNNPARRRYKEQAVQTITNDLAMLFRDANPRARFLLVPAVTSKSRTDPNYDDRLVKVCSTVASRFPNVDSFELLSISRTIASAHTGAGTRNVNAFSRILSLIRQSQSGITPVCLSLTTLYPVAPTSKLANWLYKEPMGTTFSSKGSFGREQLHGAKAKACNRLLKISLSIFA